MDHKSFIMKQDIDDRQDLAIGDNHRETTMNRRSLTGDEEIR